jgi:AdoMet-dependent rRNA methyltransferase SPB1
VKRGAHVSKDKAAERWFSHPLFKETLLTDKERDGDDDDDDEDDEDFVEGGSDDGDDDDDDDENDDEYEMVEPLDEDGVESLLNMPKSGKEMRKEQRKTLLARNLRGKEKRSERIARESGIQKGESDRLGGFEVVREDDDDADGRDDEQDEGTKAFRARIREGMGRNKAEEHAGFTVVPQTSETELPARVDTRNYNSDDEEYDNHDRAVTLALGTMMLRKSRQKALVDASYNRFAWNDAGDLPAWFTDDEIRHNRPQVPVPAALLAQVKGKFSHTGTKEIKKVAEARARKRKAAMGKLRAAKKQATTLAANSEMTESQKVRAISKAMQGTKTGAPSKVYVVAKKTQGSSSATKLSNSKGKLKFVDKRLRNDQRAEKKAEKRKKGVKKRKWH